MRLTTYPGRYDLAGLLAVTIAIFLAWVAGAQTAEPPVVDETVPPASDSYALTPDSNPQPGVPKGNVFQFEMTNSALFPGTTRTITVYVPAQYTGDKPACLYVGFDGLGFNAPTVFDNLISQHAMPVTIGIGVSPGTALSARAPKNPRFDRSFEFDSRSDRLARFVLDEVIPAVQKHGITGGRALLISSDGNDHAIGGGSTGAIAAFTVAWERPDAFRRVFSAIGTYVGMRGGETYSILVRKTEPKPLRIFMQDGMHDEWMGGPEMGDWWMSNRTMERSLEFAGYDVRHIWGVGTHNGAQASAVFPDAMRWLWKDWPKPIEARVSSNPVLQAVLRPGEDWQIESEVNDCSAAVRLASDREGNVKSVCGPERGGSAVVLPKGLTVRDFTVRSNGDIYATAEKEDGDGEVWLFGKGKAKSKLDSGLKSPSGIALSPDGLWLFVAQRGSRSGMSYRVRPDGTLDARENFYEFYVPAWADDSGAEQIGMDIDGRAYVATRMGVQIFDRNGRVTAILPLPGNDAIRGLCFGGPGFNTLYVADGKKIYRRKVKVTGAPSWSPTRVLPAWGAG